MDSARNCLHYPNMSSIPVYGLYGEHDDQFGEAWLHWETIQSRSRLHRYEIAPHRHEQFFQLLLLIGGHGRTVLDGREIDLVPPVAVVVPSLTVHGYRFSRDVDGIVLTLMERDVRELGPPFDEAAVLQGAWSVRDPLDRLIAEADHPGAGHPLAMRAQLTLLLVALHRLWHEPRDSERMSDPARRHAQSFRTLVDKRFRETRRIADYAAAIGISATHLNRVCRQILGTSALTVIERRIALEARRQLRFSDLSIKQIASDLGYDDPAYFTRLATRLLGSSPSAYRARSRRG